ncbi:hypothetical protein C2G38_2062460 [Gigaspora rosea]|uniref:Uncharacterized protein n=1 Tax=Gigaspora rosea TaxID=44941 RepID=A0A397VZ74_9GLOM|nr:hypothetical protein C2G38_2062460 [Gigaspora rosea]
MNIYLFFLFIFFLNFPIKRTKHCYNNKKDSSLFKFLDHTAIKFWLKYFFRRIMRVYPTYVIVLLSIVSLIL